MMDRRTIMASIASMLALPHAPVWAQATKIRILLNTSFSGPVSFFLLAEDRGYLRQEGLDVAFSQGGGAAVIVPQVKPGAFDAGYGDISALIELIARQSANEGPVAIYTTFNVVPFTIAVAANGPIKLAKDFEGRTITGHPVDAALVTFDLYAAAAGIDAAKVKVLRSNSGMGSQVAEMLAGSADGVFGFVNTIIASIAPLGIERNRVRFINYAEVLPEMYGNTLFVTRDLYRRDKRALTGLVRAVNRALADTVADPNVAIDALVRRSPSMRRDIDHTRLVGTLKSEMAHPEGARIGIGDMDDARLERLIRRIVSVKKLPRTPAVGEVFDRSFLPGDGERIRALAVRGAH